MRPSGVVRYRPMVVFSKMLRNRSSLSCKACTACTRSVMSRILHWITFRPSTRYTLLTNSTSNRRPPAVSNGRLSYRIYSLSCNFRNFALFAAISLKNPSSQIFSPRNCSSEKPSISSKYGFTSSITPVLASRIRMPSRAASNNLR